MTAQDYHHHDEQFLKTMSLISIACKNVLTVCVSFFPKYFNCNENNRAVAA